MARPARLRVAAIATRHACAVATLLALLLVAGTPPHAATAGVPPARVVFHGPRTEKTIALTFDDGSSPANCRRILAELVQENVLATFFPMSAAMRADPAFWRLVVQAGDPIGDHTVSHPRMPRLGYAAQLWQMTASRAAIESLTGRPMLDVFRPPFSEYNAVTANAAAAAGFPTLLLGDTSDHDTSRRLTVAQKEAAAERGTNGSVVVFHCGPNATPYLLPKVIAFYRSRGFRFVTVPDLLRLPWNTGPTRRMTTDEILGGLSPLPASSIGGSDFRVDGTVRPTPSPPAGSPAASPPALSSVIPGPSASATVAPAPKAVAGESASMLAMGALGILVAVLTASIVVRHRTR